MPTTLDHIPRIPESRKLAAPGNYQHELHFHRFRTTRRDWKHVSASRHSSDASKIRLPRGFKVISWNLRFTDNFPDQRLESALEHLQKVLSASGSDGQEDGEDERDDDRYGPPVREHPYKEKMANTEGELSEEPVDLREKLEWSKDRTWGRAGRAPPPCVILLQEVHARAIKTLLGFRWVKKHFYVTPKEHESFAHSTCFTCINLVSKQLRTGVARVLEFNRVSEQERSALMTEVLVGIRGPPGIASLRIVNVHLERDVDGAHHRRAQLSLVRKMVLDQRRGEVAPYGVIVAGSFNAVPEEDRLQLLGVHGLQDAWTGDDNDPMGFTWGLQGGHKVAHEPGRTDKITFVPSKGVAVLSPERIGVGLRREEIEKFVSDHYGIMSEVRVI